MTRRNVADRSSITQNSHIHGKNMMRSTTPTWAVLLFLACAALFGAAEEADTDTQLRPARVGNAYLSWQREHENVPEGAWDRIKELRERGELRDADRDLVARCLSAVYPDFRRALRALNFERPAQALDLLRPMLESDNPYLAANVRFFIARARMQQEDYEDAARALKNMVEESPPRTQYRGEGLFRLAICQSRLLRRKEALASITRFMRHHPEAPEWQRSRAQQLVLELMTYREGGLREVSELMHYSRRRLKRAKLDEPTIQRQERIVAVLNKIIENAEKKQGQGSGQSGQPQAGAGGSGAPRGNAPPSAPATQSALSGGTSSMGERGRTIRGRPGESWGEMPPREREKALSHIKSKFPERYRELVEQYYKSLQDEE
jgi:tetratricopeptide (TPR) repeat protein